LAIIRRKGQDLHIRKRSLTMYESGITVEKIRKAIIQEFAPMGAKLGHYEKFTANCELYILRNTIMYMHYLLSDAAKRVDSTFDLLVQQGSTTMEGSIRQEWVDTYSSATKLWKQLQDDFLNETFLTANKVKAKKGLMPYGVTIEYDNAVFRRLVGKEEFLVSFQSYIDVLHQLQQAYDLRLAEGEESASTAEIRRLKKTLAELDSSIRKKLRIKGTIEDLQAEEEEK